MASAERSVLHVLPHEGGGGETYVDLLGGMDGYDMRRVHITTHRKAHAREVASGFARVAQTLRDFDVLHVHGEGTAALFLPLLAVHPSVVTLHGLHLVRRASGWRRRAAIANLRTVLRAASRTICVSNAERDEVGRVARLDRVVVIHNGARIPASQSSSVHNEKPVGIWVGALDERRDPFTAIRAATRTETPLVFVGGGPLLEEVRHVARPPVEVVGPRADATRFLEDADFFVLLSEREGLSFGLLEAMARGLPAVVSDIPENREAIGDSGIAVPYRDEEAVAAAFLRLASTPERTELGERARVRVAEVFSADEMIGKTRALYEELLRSRST